jgi:hypothetical protein
MWARFEAEYLPDEPAYKQRSHEMSTNDKGATVTAQLLVLGEHKTVTAAAAGRWPRSCGRCKPSSTSTSR